MRLQLRPTPPYTCAQRDHTAAMHYLKRAADAGDDEAMAHLGHMLANGLVGGVGVFVCVW